MLIQEIASDNVLDTAYEWICKRRKEYTHNSDVWDLRRSWPDIKSYIQKSLLSGEYVFSPQDEIHLPDNIILCPLYG